MRSKIVWLVLAVGMLVAPLAGRAEAMDESACAKWQEVKTVEADLLWFDAARINVGDGPLEANPEPYYSFHNWQYTSDAVVCWAAYGAQAHVLGRISFDGYGSGYVTFELRNARNQRVSDIETVTVAKGAGNDRSFQLTVSALQGYGTYGPVKTLVIRAYVDGASGPMGGASPTFGG